MSEISLEVTVSNQQVSKADLVHWLRANWYPAKNLSLMELVYVAQAMINGETWRPEFFDIKAPWVHNVCQGRPYQLPDSDVVNIKVIVEEDDQEKARREQSEYWDLCKAGAEGDAAAAIEWCKLEMAHKIRHGAYA